ncbi:MAG: hypothetical protein JSR46_08405, partial [Verrucomicrobia bacterium]|nr:hypothetical protein [Verrucomicrobiota bacterium]
QVRNSHITSHHELLLTLQKEANGVQKKFKEATKRLDECSLSTPKVQDKGIGKTSLSLLAKSTASLMDNCTVKFESKEVEKLSKLFAKINKLFGITDNEDPSYKEETKTLHALKFCSPEALKYAVMVLNNSLVQKCQGKMTSEFDDKNKFKEVSIEERGSGAVAVTSLASIILTSSSGNRQICTVDATLEAIIHSKDNVELSCTFDNIELSRAALLSDAIELEKVFT